MRWCQLMWVQGSKTVTETSEQVKEQVLEVLGESGAYVGCQRKCHQEAGGVWRDCSRLFAHVPFPGAEAVCSVGSQHELGTRERRGAGLRSPAGGPSAVGCGADARAPVLHLPAGLPCVSHQLHLLPLPPPRTGALVCEMQNRHPQFGFRL